MTPNLENNPTILNIMLYHHITGTISAPSDWTSVANWLDLPNHFCNHSDSHRVNEELIREMIEHTKLTNSTDICMFWQLVDSFNVILTKQQQQELLIYLQAKSIDKLKGELK